MDIKEKAKSKKQQEFFGIVDAYKKGDLKGSEVSKSVKKAAKGMTMKQVKDFAKTKHKGLPERVDEKVNHMKFQISETQLRNMIKESMRKMINERGFSSWEEMEFRQQAMANRKARAEAKKKRDEKLGIAMPEKKKRVKSEDNTSETDKIIDELKKFFIVGGKESTNNPSMKAMQQFMRNTDGITAKKNISGGSLFTDNNQDKKREELGDVYENVAEIRKPAMELEYILSSTKKYDNQHLQQIAYKLMDLQETMPLAIHNILHSPFVIKQVEEKVPFWVGGSDAGGGHNVGMRSILKQFEKDMKNGVYTGLINKINSIIEKGRDVFSYSIKENKLRNIIKEAIGQMSLDDEMKLWDERGNDEFGSRLRKVRDLAKEVVLDAGEDVSDLLCYYCLDGKRQQIMRSLLPMLEDYDMILVDEDTNKINVEGSNNPEIAKLCIEMMQL